MSFGFPLDLFRLMWLIKLKTLETVAVVMIGSNRMLRCNSRLLSPGPSLAESSQTIGRIKYKVDGLVAIFSSSE
jgi:hypothetical protein